MPGPTSPEGGHQGVLVVDAQASRDCFANLRRIGIDEISYKRGHRYMVGTLGIGPVAAE
jgi:hypothetical protein